MSGSIQVAFMLPSSDIRAIDALVGVAYASRAEALRAAVRSWLDEYRRQEVDAALEAGYAAPPDEDMADLADVSVQGLTDAGLDW